MVLRLVQNTETGQYDYEDINKPVKPVINTAAFEAYEGDTKTTLATGTAGDTDIGQQTENILQREDPGRVTYDATTGTFKREGKQERQLGFGELPATTTEQEGKQTDPFAVAQRIAAATPIRQDMGELPDFQSMIEATQPSMKQQLFGAALDAGKDFAVRYATQKVLGKTFAGQLAGTTFASPTMNPALLANPYTLAAAALFTKPGQKAAKKIIKPVKKVVKKASSFVKKLFSDIRLKTNIEFLGKSPSNINIYSFNYIGNPIKYAGVMAHEVPWASEKHSSGYLMVDYNKLDIEFKRLN
mgnify:CR=1 FL=1